MTFPSVKVRRILLQAGAAKPPMLGQSKREAERELTQGRQRRVDVLQLFQMNVVYVLIGFDFL